MKFPASWPVALHHYLMTRIQLDMQSELVAELDELVKDTNVGTRKELFNNALTLFQWAVKEKRAGKIIASVDEANDTMKEIVLPALEAVTPKKKDSLSPKMVAS